MAEAVAEAAVVASATEVDTINTIEEEIAGTAETVETGVAIPMGK